MGRPVLSVQGIRAASLEAYMALVHAQASDELPTEEGLGADYLRILARLFATLGQKCEGKALGILRGIEDCRGVYSRSRLMRKYNPKTMAGLVRGCGRKSTSTYTHRSCRPWRHMERIRAVCASKVERPVPMDLGAMEEEDWEDGDVHVVYADTRVQASTDGASLEPRIRKVNTSSAGQTGAVKRGIWKEDRGNLRCEAWGPVSAACHSPAVSCASSGPRGSRRGSWAASLTTSLATSGVRDELGKPVRSLGRGGVGIVEGRDEDGPGEM